MIRAGITGVHGIVPPTVLSNKDLEKMVETNDEWIESRTGIKERRIFNSPGMGASDLALPAVLELLKKTNTAPEEAKCFIIMCFVVNYLNPLRSR